MLSIYACLLLQSPHVIYIVSEGVCCTKKLFASVRDLTVECVKTLHWDMSNTAQEVRTYTVGIVTLYNISAFCDYRFLERFQS